MAKEHELPDFTVQDATTYKTAIDSTCEVQSLASQFYTHQNTPVDDYAYVDEGRLLDGVWQAPQVVLMPAPPVTFGRWDIVQLNPVTGAATAVEGVEDASPVPPPPESGNIALAEIARQIGVSIIENPHIYDARRLLIPPGEAAKAYVDTGDANTLAAANAYTDAEVGTRATVVYVDTGDANTLASANTYTDTAVAGLAAVTYVDAQDVIGLAAANAYTDLLSGITIKNNVGTQIISEPGVRGDLTLQTNKVELDEYSIIRQINSDGRQAYWGNFDSDYAPTHANSSVFHVAPEMYGYRWLHDTDELMSLSTNALTLKAAHTMHARGTVRTTGSSAYPSYVGSGIEMHWLGVQRGEIISINRDGLGVAMPLDIKGSEVEMWASNMKTMFFAADDEEPEVRSAAFIGNSTNGMRLRSDSIRMPTVLPGYIECPMKLTFQDGEKSDIFTVNDYGLGFGGDCLEDYALVAYDKHIGLTAGGNLFVGDTATNHVFIDNSGFKGHRETGTWFTNEIGAVDILSETEFDINVHAGRYTSMTFHGDAANLRAVSLSSLFTPSLPDHVAKFGQISPLVSRIEALEAAAGL